MQNFDILFSRISNLFSALPTVISCIYHLLSEVLVETWDGSFTTLTLLTEVKIMLPVQY